MSSIRPDRPPWISCVGTWPATTGFCIFFVLLQVSWREVREGGCWISAVGWRYENALPPPWPPPTAAASITKKKRVRRYPFIKLLFLMPAAGPLRLPLCCRKELVVSCATGGRAQKVDGRDFCFPHQNREKMCSYSALIISLSLSWLSFLVMRRRRRLSSSSSEI